MCAMGYCKIGAARACEQSRPLEPEKIGRHERMHLQGNPVLQSGLTEFDVLKRTSKL
jgi:hypothetical protein